MAKKKKRELSGSEKRSMRIQQIVFVILGIMIILSLVISLIVNI